MNHSTVLEGLRHPWLHPFRFRSALVEARSLFGDLAAGRQISFRPRVQVEDTCYIVSEDRVISRTVKAYRIRRTGKVYVDLYTPPPGRIFTLDDIHATYDGAMSELAGRLARKSADEVRRRMEVSGNE